MQTSEYFSTALLISCVSLWAFSFTPILYVTLDTCPVLIRALPYLPLQCVILALLLVQLCDPPIYAWRSLWLTYLRKIFHVLPKIFEKEFCSDEHISLKRLLYGRYHQNSLPLNGRYRHGWIQLFCHFWILYTSSTNPMFSMVHSLYIKIHFLEIYSYQFPMF